MPSAEELAKYRHAISSIESSHNYRELGPVTKHGDRAYGRYQVMGANVPAWSEAATGKRMTPQEFLKDDKAQDAVFDHRFGKYVDQYGNPQDAASVWFSGKPMSKAGNVSDQLGTTVPGYVGKFNKALGQPDTGTIVAQDRSAPFRPVAIDRTGPTPTGMAAIQAEDTTPPGDPLTAWAKQQQQASAAQTLASMYAMQNG